MKYFIAILLISSLGHANNPERPRPEDTEVYSSHGRDLVARACIGISELLNSDEADVTYYYDKLDAQYQELNCDHFLPKGALTEWGKIK